MTQMGWTFDPERPVYARRVEEERPEIINRTQVMAYLWSRTVLCPACTGLIPLAPNWRLDQQQKLGIRVTSNERLLVPDFEVVNLAQSSRGTIKKGIAVCIHCGYVCPKLYPRDQAQAGRLGHLQYCEVIRRWYPVYRGGGKPPMQAKTRRVYRVPLLCPKYADDERFKALVSAGLLEYVIENELGFGMVPIQVAEEDLGRLEKEIEYVEAWEAIQEWGRRNGSA